MAVITIGDAIQLLQDGFYETGDTVDLTKPQVKAVYQVLEDWFEGQRGPVATLIDGVTVPLGVTLSNAQKKTAVRAFLFRKFKREGG